MQSHRIRQLLAFHLVGLVVLALPVGTGTPRTIVSADQARPTSTNTITLEAERLLAWGLERYEAEGLELPEITLRVESSLAPCDGRVGRYVAATRELTMCRSDEYTIIHELAHAWANHNLTDDDRRNFVHLRDLDHWNDHNEPWEARGTEHAAEVLTWALMDHDRTVPWVQNGVETRRLLTIDRSSTDELTQAFVHLVGRSPKRRAPQPETTTSSEFSPEARLNR